MLDQITKDLLDAYTAAVRAEANDLHQHDLRVEPIEVVVAATAATRSASVDAYMALAARIEALTA